MKLVSIFLLWSILLSSVAIDEVRNLFPKIDNLEQAENYIKLLQEDQSVEAKGYSAVMILMKSRYVTFPFTKLKYFKIGKKKLNKVIVENPNNIEMRYIRFLMQKEIPKFLGYHKNIEEDFNKIINGIVQCGLENSLKNKIIENMMLVSNLTFDEEKELTKIIQKL